MHDDIPLSPEEAAKIRLSYQLRFCLGAGLSLLFGLAIGTGFYNLLRFALSF